MRIIELLESKQDELDPEKNKYGLDFDLSEDVVYFMNNDDDTYRRHVYPTIVKCMKQMKDMSQLKPSIFKTATLESYKNYIKKFPQIRELPDSLDEELTNEICDKLHEEFCKYADEGKYK